MKTTFTGVTIADWPRFYVEPKHVQEQLLRAMRRINERAREQAERDEKREDSRLAMLQWAMSSSQIPPIG